MKAESIDRIVMISLMSTIACMMIGLFFDMVVMIDVLSIVFMFMCVVSFLTCLTFAFVVRRIE